MLQRCKGDDRSPFWRQLLGLRLTFLYSLQDQHATTGDDKSPFDYPHSEPQYLVVHCGFCPVCCVFVRVPGRRSSKPLVAGSSPAGGAQSTICRTLPFLLPLDIVVTERAVLCLASIKTVGRANFSLPRQKRLSSTANPAISPLPTSTGTPTSTPRKTGTLLRRRIHPSPNSALPTH